MAAIIVTLQEAKDCLRVTHNTQDGFIGELTGQAEGIVLDWLKKSRETSAFEPEGGWTHDNAPGPLRAAIYRVLTFLWTNPNGVAPLGEDFPGSLIRGLLMRLRDPTVA